MLKSNKNVSRNRTFSPEHDYQDSLKKEAFYSQKNTKAEGGNNGRQAQKSNATAI